MEFGDYLLQVYGEQCLHYHLADVVAPFADILLYNEDSSYPS